MACYTTLNRHFGKIAPQKTKLKNTMEGELPLGCLAVLDLFKE